MHDLFFPFYSVGIERKVNTGTFTSAKVNNLYQIAISPIPENLKCGYPHPVMASGYRHRSDQYHT